MKLGMKVCAWKYNAHFYHSLKALGHSSMSLSIWRSFVYTLIVKANYFNLKDSALIRFNDSY